LYTAALHRYLRWRLPGYDAQRNLAGVLYLFLRGMSGPDTPTVDGTPCGVFAWAPSKALVEALSDVLDGQAAAGAFSRPSRIRSTSAGRAARPGCYASSTRSACSPPPTSTWPSG